MIEVNPAYGHKRTAMELKIYKKILRITLEYEIKAPKIWYQKSLQLNLTQLHILNIQIYLKMTVYIQTILDNL